MNIGGSQANDAFLRVPVQGRILHDAGPALPAGRDAAPADGAIGAQRSDSLRTVSGNRIDAPVTGGLIGRPGEGAPEMEETETGPAAFAALMRHFAMAQGMARGETVR